MSLNNTELKNSEDSDLNINTLNVALTPTACASIISEILKCLIYEKSLIPYPYSWLRTMVIEKRKSEHKNKDMFTERHLRMASAAYDAIENIISNIKKIFKFGNNIKEVIILIGATPLCAKEVYKFNIPNLAKGHIDRNHFNILAKDQPKILRSILLSEKWMIHMEQSIPVTNLYVFLKIDEGTNFMMDNKTLESFKTTSSYYAPKSAKFLTINLQYDDNIVHNCCSNLKIYEDNENSSSTHKKDFDDLDKSDNKFNDLVEINVNCIQVNSVLNGFKK